MFGFLDKIFHARETEKMRKGRIGENHAAAFLKKERGMKVLVKNYRTKRYEIDIVALDADCLVFVEVKTRSDAAQVDGYYAAISVSKRKAMSAAARAYISALRKKPSAWRYDVVDVRMDADCKVCGVSHFEHVSL